jgi:hypothetical protein
MTATGFLISKIFNIRAGEHRMAALVIGVMLLTSAGSALGSTGAETLFLARFGVQYLPIMTMLLGMLSFATTLGITALMGRFRREALYVFIPAGLAATIVLAWAALFSGWPLIYPVLWLGKEIINSLTSLVVWGLAGAACDTRQTKRLFPLFNASRILGGVLGGFLTGVLAAFFGTPQLMLAWAATLVVSLGLIRTLINTNISPQPTTPRSRRKQQPGMIQEMQSGFQFVRRSNLMRWISLAAMLFSVMYFFVFQSFSRAASNQFPGDENSLAGFLGLFYGICTAAAFLTSILAANRLYVRIGIMNAILTLPLIYLSGFGAQIFSSTFVVIIIFRFAQQLWLAGIADSAWQAVFNTVPANRRDQVRAFVGGVPEQAGTFAAGVALVIGEQAFTSSQFALLGIAAAAITVFAIWRARLAYFRGLVESLRAGRPAIFDANTRAALPLDAAA